VPAVSAVVRELAPRERRIVVDEAALGLAEDEHKEAGQQAGDEGDEGDEGDAAP